MHIRGPAQLPHSDAEALLRSLPEWFGVPAARSAYAQACSTLPCFAAESAGALQGLIALEQHFPESWEIHCLAVAPTLHRQGIGRTLLAHAEAWLHSQGARWLQVKTLADTHPSGAYAGTRAFYRAVGYSPLQVFPQLWAPEHPCLLMIKPLAT